MRWIYHLSISALYSESTNWSLVGGVPPVGNVDTSWWIRSVLVGVSWVVSRPSRVGWEQRFLATYCLHLCERNKKYSVHTAFYVCPCLCLCVGYLTTLPIPKNIYYHFFEMIHPRCVFSCRYIFTNSVSHNIKYEIKHATCVGWLSYGEAVFENIKLVLILP